MNTSAYVTVSAVVAGTTQVEDLLRDRGHRSFAVWRARPVNGGVTLTITSASDVHADVLAGIVADAFGI